MDEIATDLLYKMV